eukprot:7645983-Ditylum_brightwellii.AAC.1
MEQSEYVACEGLMWWSKLKHSEVPHWIDVAMQYFEYYIIEWKKEANIRLMLEAGEEMEKNMVGNEDEVGPDQGDDPDGSADAALD